MSDAPALMGRGSATEAADDEGGPWLLEVKASKRGLTIWLLGMVLFVLPLIAAMSVVLIWLLIWGLVTPQPNAPAAWPFIDAAMLCACGPAMVGAVWFFARNTVGLWICLRRGRPAVRADDRGLETFNLLKWRWDRMPWEEVGTLANPQVHTLVVEHIDPKAWLARQNAWTRFGRRQAHKQMGVYPAMGFGIPLEEPTEDVMAKIASLRDVHQAGLKVFGPDEAGFGDGTG